MDIEQTLNSTIFIPSVKNGFYDYSTPLMNIEKFDTDKSSECTQTLFEYLCYKIVKKRLLEGKINSDTVLITDQFLSTFNCKQLFIKTNAIHKKHIVIFLRNQISQKWNLIAFLDLEQQLKNCFDQTNKKPITAKIISSSQNSDEDDYILNSTMDKLENRFNFKSPDDIQFEVDSINISDQPNTSIFLLNFIDGLMSQTDNESILLYIKKLYDEGSNNIDQSSKDYFNSFNRLNEEFENICTKYKKELNEYKSINGIKFDGEKIMNGSNEILNVAISNGLTVGDCQNGQGEIINGMNPSNLNSENNNKMKDDIDMIQIEQDDDLDDELNSEEEEEALKIMERENKVAKSQMREQERKLRQRMYKQKLRLKNINMYKEFGVIKEEDNESESESIDYFSKIKEEEAKNKEAIIDIKKSLKKSLEYKKNKNDAKNNGKNNMQNNEKNMVILNTENNINNNNSEFKKEILNTENIKTETEVDQKCKSEKRIKLSVLKDLEEAIEEFESEQDPTKSIEGNNSNSNNNSNCNNNSNSNNNSINLNNNKSIEKENKKIQMGNETKETKNENKENKDEGNKDVKENRSKIEKKFSIKSNVDENKKINTKNSNSSRNNNYIKKESADLKAMKKGSIPKGKVKEKEQVQDNKDKVLLINKLVDNPKKPSIGDSKNQEKDKDKKKEKEKTKEKKSDENLNKIIKNSNRNTSKSKNQSNNSVKNNKSISTINSKNSKDQDNNSTSNNSTSNIVSKDSFKSFNSSNNSKNMNDSEKSSNKEKEKENIRSNLVPLNNIMKKSGNANINNNIKKKSSKNFKKTNSKKSNKEVNNSNASIPLSQKVTAESKQTSSSLKTEEPVNSFRNSVEKKNIKEVVPKNNKEYKDFVIIESKNGLTPDKLAKRNGYDLKKKERIENGSNKIINLDLNSNHNERYYGDCSSNINIENISSDDFESESSKYKKNEYNEGGSFYGENRTKKTTYKRGDKKMKIPPGKSRTNHTNYSNQFCNYDEEGNSKPCGCIGEQANALCFIF